MNKREETFIEAIREVELIIVELATSLGVDMFDARQAIADMLSAINEFEETDDISSLIAE